MKLLNTILNIVFPVYCISCKKEGVDLCKKCLLSSPPVLRESATWIFPLFDYRHPPIKKSIWLLKYKNRKKLASIFAEIMYGRIMEELSELSIMQNFREPILIPIPLSSKRYRKRGYNQAELICLELIKIDLNANPYHRHGKAILANDIDVSKKTNRNFKLEKNILVKTRETEHQATLRNRKNRLKNLANSFSVKNIELVKGKNIILIDDVVTTGATLDEAKKILKQAGAKKK